METEQAATGESGPIFFVAFLKSVFLFNRIWTRARVRVRVKVCVGSASLPMVLDLEKKQNSIPDVTRTHQLIDYIGGGGKDMRCH